MIASSLPLDVSYSFGGCGVAWCGVKNVKSWELVEKNAERHAADASDRRPASLFCLLSACRENMLELYVCCIVFWRAIGIRN